MRNKEKYHNHISFAILQIVPIFAAVKIQDHRFMCRVSA